ncbi:MAG TPA: hypothetical protein VLT45_16975 [Kofleriaceae bacterium]|nr:hypothetical protein [Kofleriaceae bacterium]
MNRTLIAILFAAGCTTTVRSAPPAEPAPPPPPPPQPRVRFPWWWYLAMAAIGGIAWWVSTHY